MGWFWADSKPSDTSAAAAAAPNHPTAGTPPPACPMYKKDVPEPPSDCPYTPPGDTSKSSKGDHTVNPLNMMFAHLPQTASPGQKTVLPIEREVSSIPKGSESGNWEYPSPQQMFNAMRRKGYEDAPEDAVESMVAIHNWINEGAWQEILAWEEKYSAGVLGRLGYREKHGEWVPKLLRFEGRRNDPTPKSQMYGFLGRLMPETFGGPAPFDRHDWFVLRKNGPDENPKEVRYVIDYYAGPPEPTGEPVFFLDVRPAIDRPGLMMERIVDWSSGVWEKAAGADVRERKKEEASRKASQ